MTPGHNRHLVVPRRRLPCCLRSNRRCREEEQREHHTKATVAHGFILPISGTTQRRVSHDQVDHYAGRLETDHPLSRITSVKRQKHKRWGGGNSIAVSHDTPYVGM